MKPDDVKLSAVLATLFLMVSVVAPAAALVNGPVGEGSLALVIARHPEAVATAAQVKLVGPIAAPFAVFAQIDTEEQITALSDAGSWAIIDGEAIAYLCGFNPDSSL